MKLRRHNVYCLAFLYCMVVWSPLEEEIPWNVRLQPFNWWFQDTCDCIEPFVWTIYHRSLTCCLRINLTFFCRMTFIIESQRIKYDPRNHELPLQHWKLFGQRYVCCRNISLSTCPTFLVFCTFNYQPGIIIQINELFPATLCTCFSGILGNVFPEVNAAIWLKNLCI